MVILVIYIYIYMTLSTCLFVLKSHSVYLAWVRLDWNILMMVGEFCTLICQVGENAFFFSLSSDYFHRGDRLGIL